MTSSDISAEIKEKLKKEFPDLTFSVTKQDYSGGRSITVAWMRGFDPFSNDNFRDEGYLQINHFYIDSDSRINEQAKKVLNKVFEIANFRNWDKSDPMTDYFNVNYYLHIHIGKWDKKYEITSARPSSGGRSSSATTTTGRKPRFDLGDKITDCGGWGIYKKTLDDNRVVYSAALNKGTSKTSYDWNLVKGDIYTEAGWKWSKFGKFEKWGNIENESENIEKLCSLLRKYYVQDQPTSQTSGVNQEKLKKTIEALSILASNGNEFAQKQVNILKLLIN